ncbi:MAG: hypothetical protein ACLFVE_13260 [Chitinispirillaceae bacterium]
MKSAKTLLIVLIFIPFQYVATGCGTIDTGFSDSTDAAHTDTVETCGSTYSAKGVLGASLLDTEKDQFTVTWEKPSTGYPLDKQIRVYVMEEVDPEVIRYIDLSDYPIYWTDHSCTIKDSLNTLLDARYEILLTEICETLPAD